AALLLAGCAIPTSPETKAGTADVGADVSERLADAARNGGDWPNAVKLYQRAIAAKPEKPELYLGLGESLVAMGAIDDGVVALKKASSLAPQRTEALLALGRIYLVRQKYNM